MKQSNNFRKTYFIVITAIIIFGGCKKTCVSYIQDETTAKELVESVRKSLDSLNNRIPINFDNPDPFNFTNFNGVMVSGKKEENSESSNGFNKEWKKSDIGIRFDGFSNDKLIITSGTGEYHYSYFHTWQGIGDSTLMVTVTYELNSCGFNFTHNNCLYRGTVTINYSSQDNLATRYEATVNIAGGKSFKITGICE